MADNELTLKLKLEDQQFKAAMKEVVSFGKLIETEYKRGKISATEAGNAVNKLMVGIDGLGKVAKPSTDALASLWHMQNRIGLGFKSLATETVGARNQFKEMLSEQRLGNRLMSGTVGSVKMLSNAFGIGGLGGSVGKMADSFQGMEFAINGMGTAMTSAGGKVGAFGSAMMGIAGPLTIAGAALTYVIGLYNEAAAAAEKAGRATSGAFMTSMEKRLQAENPGQFLGIMTGRLGAADADVLKKQGAWMNIKSSMENATGGGWAYLAIEEKKAYKAFQEAQLERIRLADIVWEAQQKEKKNADDRSKFVSNVDTGVVPAGVAATFYGPSMAYGLGGAGVGTGQAARANIPGQLMGVTPKPESWGQSKTPTILWGELSQEAKVFYSGMTSMTSTLGNEIMNGLGAAFSTVFGEANSLMERLLQGFIMGVADALLRLGMSSALSAIPVVGPFLGAAVGGGINRGGSSIGAIAGTETSYSSNSGILALSTEVAMLSKTIRSGRWDVEGSKLRYVMNKDLNNDRFRRL